MFQAHNLWAAFFYFSQVIWHLVQKQNFMDKYIKNNKIRKTIAFILVLPYCPKPNFHIFDKIFEYAKNKDCGEWILSILAVFERVCSNQETDVKTREKSFWSVYSSFLNGVTITTKNLKAWHVFFNQEANFIKTRVSSMSLNFKENVRIVPMS